MNKPTPSSLAQQCIDRVERDSALLQLRERHADFERKLQAAKDEAAAAMATLERNQGVRGSSSNASDAYLTMRASPHTDEALRERVRQKRAEEAQFAEGVRITRGLLRQREDAAYYAALEDLLRPAQLQIGGRMLNAMIEQCELWHEERALRAPLGAVGRADIAQISTTRRMATCSVREQLETLLHLGYIATPEQIRRVAALPEDV